MARYVILVSLLALMMLPLSGSSETTATLQEILLEYEIALQTVEDGLASLESQLAIAESLLTASNQELIGLRSELKGLKKEAAILRGRLLRSQIVHSELELALNSAGEQMKSLQDSFESYKQRITKEIQELLRKERGKRILWGLVGVGAGVVIGLLLN